MTTYSGGATNESYIAGTSLASGQNLAVALNGTASVHGAQVKIVDGTAAVPIGVLINKPTAGAAAAVQMDGIAKVVSNGATVNIAAGDWVKAGPDGKAYKCGTAPAQVLGRAQEASTTDGRVIQVLLDPGTVAVI